MQIAPGSLPRSPEKVDVFLSQPNERVLAALSHMEGDFIVLGAGGKMGLHLCAMLRNALIGRRMPRALKETSEGGLAVTPAALSTLGKNAVQM